MRSLSCSALLLASALAMRLTFQLGPLTVPGVLVPLQFRMPAQANVSSPPSAAPAWLFTHSLRIPCCSWRWRRQRPAAGLGEPGNSQGHLATRGRGPECAAAGRWVGAARVRRATAGKAIWRWAGCVPMSRRCRWGWAWVTSGWRQGVGCTSGTSCAGSWQRRQQLYGHARRWLPKPATGADVHGLLGDVAMESDDFGTAMTELDAALRYLQKFVEVGETGGAASYWPRHTCCAPCRHV